MQPVTIQMSPYFTKRYEEQGRVRGRRRADAKDIIARLEMLPLHGESVKLTVGELSALVSLQIIVAVKVENDTLHCKLDLSALQAIAAHESAQALEQLALVIFAISELLRISSVHISFAKGTNTAERIQLKLWLVVQNALFASRFGVQELLIENSYVDSVSQDIQSMTISASQEGLRQQALELIQRHGLRFSCTFDETANEVKKNVAEKTSHASTSSSVTQQTTEDQPGNIWSYGTDAPNVKLRWYVEVDAEDSPRHIACSVEYASAVQRVVIETYTVVANRLLARDAVSEALAAGKELLPEYFAETTATHPLTDFVSAFARRFVPASEFARDDAQVSLQIDVAQGTACRVCGAENISVFGSYGICQVCGGAQMVSSA